MEDEILAQEASILAQIREMQQKGLWGKPNLKKTPDIERNKTHWDYLLEEMAWMANDFRDERQWKIRLARRTAKQVLKYHEDQKKQLRKKASAIAALVQKDFWSKIHKIVQLQHQSK